MSLHAEKGVFMFFEMLFSILISFALGALAMIVLMCHLVFDGVLIIEKTSDKEKRKERKREKRKEREEKEEKKKTENEKTE
jgi:heme exporter protein D